MNDRAARPAVTSPVRAVGVHPYRSIVDRDVKPPNVIRGWWAAFVAWLLEEP